MRSGASAPGAKGARENMATKRRSLSDLYMVGKLVEVDDGEGPVPVWLQKLNPLDTEQAFRKAAAARARVLIARKDREGDAFMALWSEVSDIGSRETLIDYVIADDLGKFSDSLEAQLMHDEEWSKDGYLQGLQDSWESEMQERWLADKEDQEAVKVFDELSRFNNEVQKKLDGERDRLRKDYANVSLEDLEAKAVDRLLEMKAQLVWMQEYRRAVVWRAARDPENHKKYYFNDRSQVDELAPEVTNQLIDAYEAMTVSVPEGKELPSILSSLDSLEPSNEEETQASSGPQAAAQ